jgi:hypothetical protein
MYIGAATDATASRIVLAAECFVSPRFFDARVIQRYSSAVVLHPKPDTHFADLQHVCEFVRQIGMQADVRSDIPGGRTCFLSPNHCS